jgi:hypothetical protein
MAGLGIAVLVRPTRQRAWSSKRLIASDVGEVCGPDERDEIECENRSGCSQAEAIRSTRGNGKCDLTM